MVIGRLISAFSLFAILLAMPAKAAELVMFEQAGCHWCAVWHKEIGPIYPKTEEGKRFPLRRVDIHTRVPVDLKAVSKGFYTPTFVLLDDGKEIGRIQGYPGEDFFWGLLGQMVQDALNKGDEAS
ncbi:hypothetical protein GR183_11950 [Stappia sp. GBMRC 2046]|uniref:Thioredoxin family protein n=1 Tax=Stappia sediminis TaxID=2692190 RepID=A0A7X3LV02_9HYPH|nr:hypothetical protein [Stappia sediminis]MXN65617.1 hypothetical protein [Stappia sediminis]